MTTRQKKPSLLLLFFFSGICLRAQIIPYEKYTSKDGLVADRITAISQDAQGFMWFGSYFGICRYNGIAFENIRLPSSQQNKYVLFLSPAGGKMYAGFLFNGGLAEYDNGRVRSHFIHGKDSVFANEFVSMTEEGDGNILLCNSTNQLYRFKNGNFHFLCQLRERSLFFPKSILKDRFNNVWVATEKGLFILRYPYHNATVFFPDENIFSLAQKEDGRIVFTRTDGKLSKTISCAGWNGQFIDQRLELTDKGMRIVPFIANHAKNIWGIDAAKGLFTINSHQNKTYYNIPLDLNTDISTVFVDRENNVWVANEPGVFKISNFNSKFYPFEEVAAGGGMVHRENDSVVWASNSKSLYYIKEDRMVKVSFLKPMPDYFTLLHIDTEKNLWLGSWNQGLWRTKYRPGKPLSLTDYSVFGKKKVVAHTMMEDAEHNIWVAGINGIFRIRNGRIQDSYQPLNAAGQPAFIICMALDEATYTLWLGDNASGIIQLNYKPERNKPFVYRVEGYIGAAQGLSDNYIRSLFFDHRNNLWAGTRFGGIYKINRLANGLRVTNYNQEAGLECTRITDISEEDTTAIWFASCDGMYRYEEATGKWRHYSTSDGIMNAEVYDIMVDKNKGFVWGLGGQGVNKILMTQEEKVPPLVSITSITVLGKQDTDALASPTAVQYPYNRNSIGFSFAGASFIDEKKILYRYMLKGYDRQWSEPVITNNVNYASLPPGNYVFKVMAANAKGQWSVEPATFSFEVVIPFYRRPFFIFLMITLGIFVLYAIRIQRLRHRFLIEKLRLNIAQDLHDDIGSTLGSINLLSKTAKRRLDKHLSAEEISPIFQKIGESAENTLEAMDDIVWSINPSKDKMEDLLVRMREFAIPLFEARNLDFDFSMNGIQDQTINMNLRRNAFLIYKESIHNILKHADASRVEVRLYLDHGQFSLMVQDNGKGFLRGQATSRHGLKNMQNRAVMVRGRIQIHSTEGGTSILFQAPIK